MSKRSTARTSAARPVRHRPRWVRLLLGLSLLPMAAGLVLLVAALAGGTWLGSPVEQAGLGGLLALEGFALANALQQLWRPAAGWALIGAAAGLAGFLGNSGTWALVLAALLAGSGAVLLGGEFARRLQAPRDKARR